MKFKNTKSKRFISVLLSLSIISSMFPQTWQIGYAESSDVAVEEIESQSLDNNSELIKQEFNGHLYAVIDDSMTWTDAKEYCEELGGHLLTITSDEENNYFIDSLFSQSSKSLCWLGGYYDATKYKWKWVTDEEFNYSNWDRCMPDRNQNGQEYEDYLMTYKNSNPGVSGSQKFKWNDMYVDGIYPGEEYFFHTDLYCFVCEWDFIPVKEPVESELNYAVFSGSQTQGINLYGWKSRFDGNIYAGNGFNYGGSELYVTGRIDSAGAIITNGWITEIDERNEYIDAIKMPDYDKVIHDKAEPYEYFEQSPAYVQDRNVINSSIKVGGDVVISGTTFEGDCYIIADGNITYNVESFVSAGRVFLYSRNGSITVNGSQIDINGAMYAPNGSVTFNTYDTTITGFICADTINFNGSIFNVTGANFDMVKSRTKGIVKTYTTDNDFAEGTLDGVSLAVPDQLILAEEYGTSVPVEKIYGDTESGKGIKITYTSDKSALSDKDASAVISYDLSGFGEADVSDNAVDLLILIDESWSMQDYNRLAYAKSAAKEIVSQMKANDRCAVVGFSWYIHDVIKFSSDKTEINNAIDKINYNNGTDIANGLNYAIKQFGSSDRQKYIILLSDGEDSTNSSVAAKKAAGSDIRIFALMIGTGTLQMQNIAINSNGIYKNAPTSDEIGKIMSYFASEVFNVAGRNTTFKTTITNRNFIDLSSISPVPAAVTENADGSITLEWHFDRISIDEAKSITIPISATDAEGFAELAENTSCVYYDRSGKPHVIYLDDVTLPISNYVDKGSWSVIFDSEQAAVEWSNIYWNGLRVGDSKIVVNASASEDGIDFGEPVAVVNYENISGLCGRFLKLDVEMTASSDGRTPELYDITAVSADAEKKDYVNERPVAKIHAKSAAKVHMPVSIRAEITDDCLSSDIVSVWSCDSDSVVFSNETGLFTSAVFSETGEYTISCTVSDGENTFETTCSIKVEALDEYEDIDPDVIEKKAPEIYVDLPQYADKKQVINSKIELLNDTEISWYSVIFKGNTAVNVADDGSFSLTMPNSNGTYHVAVRAFDWAGNCDIKEFDIIVDSSVPEILVSASADTVCADETAYYTVTKSVSQKIKSITYTINGQNIAETEDGIYPLNTQEPGVYEFCAEAVTYAGGILTAKAVITVVEPDITAPTVNIAFDKELYVEGDSLNAVITANDDIGVDRVELYINGEEAAFDANYNFTVDVLEAGIYEITAKAFDAAGNCGYSTYTFDIADMTCPELTLTVDKSIVEPGEAVTINVSALDKGGIASVELFLNDTAVELTDNTAIFVPDSVGEYVVKAVAKDNSGNSVTRSITVSVVEYDRESPTISVSFDKDIYYISESASITVTAQDNIAVSEVVVKFNDEILNGSDNVYATPELSEGVHFVKVTAYDEAGNWSTVTYQITVDTELDITAPEVSIVGISPAEIYTGDSVTIAITATDESGISEVTATINGETVPVIDGMITYIPETVGSYEVVVTAVDAFGNSQSASAVFEVLERKTQDTTPPNIHITASFPSSIPRVNDTIKFNVTASDDSGSADLTVLVNGEELYGNNGVYQFTPKSSGSYVVSFIASDPAGNITLFDYPFVVYEKGDIPTDTTNPTGNITFNKISAVVGEEIIADIEAQDDSGEVFIEAKVNGEPVEIVNNQLRFIPTEAGKYTFVITLSDAAGNKSICNRIITVTEADVTAPRLEVNSIPDAIILGQQIEITASATDDSGTVYLTASINGAEIDISNGTAVFTPETAGDYTIVIIASDNSGNERNFTKTVHVVEPGTEDITAPELEIISFPAQAVVGEEVRLEFTTFDDSGNVFAKVTVNGEEIEYSNGAAVFTPETAGSYDVVISVYDAAGNSRTARGTITVTAAVDDTIPTLSITGLTNQMSLGETAVVTIIAEDDSGSVTVTAYINGEAVEIANGQFEFTPEQTGSYTILIRAEDAAGNYVQKEIDVLVSELSAYEDSRPVVTIYANDGWDTARLGDTIDVNVTAYDPDGIAALTVTLNDEEINLDAAGNASFTPSEIGRYVISAKAVDVLGNEICESYKIMVINTEDTSVCDIAITSPADGSVITEPTDIIGTVSGDGLVFYSLEYCPVDSAEYTEFAYSSDPVNNGVLGNFDPTLLENGYYIIRLTAYSSCYSVEQEIVVSVEGQMKIGNYSIAFQDMDIPVTGYPLTVIRSYDSRRKQTSGDFGYGWDLSLSSIKLNESCAPGKYWSQKNTSSMFGSKYFFSEDRVHEISVDYGNGQVDKFKMKLSPDQQNLYPINYGISVSYEAQGNTKSTLEAIGTTTDLIYNGGTMCYSSTITPYAPSQYKLTRADGTVYILSAANGVEKITDTNGNVITFTENGVTHSDGKSITFERDSENRITRITGSSGKTIEYSYDVNGNLSVVTDEAGKNTAFKYDRNHYLADIIDSRGVKIARNEYDENGRLIATVDANGNRLEFSHDIDGRRDVVTDRLGNSTLYIYDNRGNVISETDALGNTTLSTYDERGNLKTRTDALGNTTTYNYDSQGNLISVMDALGNTVTNTYSEKGQLLSISSMGVTQFIVNYDEFGNLTSTEDGMGGKTEYDYDKNGRVTSISDSVGSYMKMYYDADGNVVSSINGNGETASFTYDSEGNCSSKTITRRTESGVESLTEQYSYDVYGNVIQIIYADGSVTSMEYDSVGNMTAAVDAKGRRTSYEYDLFGNLVKITYCDNTTETFEYDAEGRNTKATDRLGRSVEMTYDAVGNLISKIYPNGSQVSYTYDAKYRLVSVTGANGGVTRYEYDVLDRNMAIIDALGNRTEFGYGATNGQLETMTDAKGNTYTYGYDLNGNRTSVTMPDGTSVTTDYDARGRVISQADQHGYTTKYSYDGADRLTSVTDALGNVWSYEYNSVGELVSITDANGNVTRYEYDNAGRVIKTTNAAGSSATVVYDEAGNVLKSTDYAGNVTTYTYDDFDRVIAKAVGGDTTCYAYTADGMLSGVTDKNGTISYNYDVMNGLTSVTLYDGKTIDYTYDEACRLTSVETPFGATQYEYDLMDRIVRVVANDGKATLYEYDANGNRTAVRYANGLVVTYEYDEVNRLVREKILDKNGAPVVEYTYTLGAAGERIKVEETGAASDRTVEYEYDELYRLVKETVSNDNGITVTEYTYDRNSNRLTKTVDGDVISYAYNELNQLVSETGIAYEYDLNGNLIKKTEADQTTTYTYNAQNRLIRVTVRSGQQVNVEEYRYDYAGNRIAKIDELSATYYLVDTNGVLSQVLAEYDENGSLTTLYTRGDELISQERNGVKSYYLYDGFDSVRMLTDEGGSVTDTYTFDAFGNLTDSTGDTENSYLYRGEQYDSSTGLYYLRARYMNPSTGTFITMDEYAGSVFEPVSLHKYLYANANPVMNSDPTGYETLKGQLTTAAGIAVLSTMLVANYNGILNAMNFMLTEICTSVAIAADTVAEWCEGLANGQITSSEMDNEVKDSAMEDSPNADDSGKEESDDKIGRLIGTTRPGRKTRGRTDQREKERRYVYCE